jgi:biotin operon repressor
MYIVFAVIPRVPLDEGYSFSRESGVYSDDIAVFRTSNEEVARAVAELLTKDYEDGPGEDYPECFIFESEAEMSLKDCVRAHDQLSNPEDWAIEIRTKAEEYVRKMQSVPKLPDTCRQPISKKALNQPIKQDQKTLLSERQREIWDLLEGQCLLAKELGNKLDLSDVNIRKHIQKIRKNWGEKCIKMRRGRGYWRPDAPPPDCIATKT